MLPPPQPTDDPVDVVALYRDSEHQPSTLDMNRLDALVAAMTPVEHEEHLLYGDLVAMGFRVHDLARAYALRGDAAKVAYWLRVLGALDPDMADYPDQFAADPPRILAELIMERVARDEHRDPPEANR